MQSNVRRVEPQPGPMRPIEAAERLVTLSSMVVAAAIVGERERVFDVVDRFFTVALRHLADVGPSMWREADGSLWRTYHLALIGRTRGVVRAVLLDECATEPADEFAFVAERYRRALTRRYLRGSHDFELERAAVGI